MGTVSKRKLKVGDRVRWTVGDPNPNGMVGTVVEVNVNDAMGTMIKWDTYERPQLQSTAYLILLRNGLDVMLEESFGDE